MAETTDMYMDTTKYSGGGGMEPETAVIPLTNLFIGMKLMKINVEFCIKYP